jgi:hypothetical protein
VQESYHDGENTFLHFTRILGTKNDHLHALEVDLDRCGRAHALGEAIGGELSSIVDDEIRFAEVS